MTVFWRLRAQSGIPLREIRFAYWPKREGSYENKRLLLTVVISAGLAFSVAAQEPWQAGEMVGHKSLPGSVQQTINRRLGRDGWGEKGRRHEWQMELRGRYKNERERMGL